MYINPDLKQTLYPDIAKVVKYISQADEEVTARDVRPLMSFLLRMTQSSPRIKGHIVTRRTALSAYDWNITDDDGSIKLRTKKAIATIIQNHCDTPLYGNLLFQINTVFNEVLQSKTMQLKRILPFQYKIKDEYTFIRIDDNNNEIEVIDFSIPNNNFLGETDGETTTGGILRSISFAEILRNTTLHEWGNLNLRLKGILLGLVDVQKFVNAANQMNYSKEQSVAEYQALEDTLKSAGENNYGIMQNSLEVKLAQIADAAAGKSFADFKKELESDIAIAILGQANTSELPSNGGSRAALQVLNMIRQDIHYSDMIRVKELIDNFLLIDYRLNVEPNASVCPYEFNWVYEESLDYESNTRIIEILSRIGLPIDISKDDLYRITNIPKPIEGTADLIQLKSTSTSIF